MIFWGKSCFEVFGPEETKNGLKMRRAFQEATASC